jgi:hypothetical protein
MGGDLLQQARILPDPMVSRFGREDRLGPSFERRDHRVSQEVLLIFELTLSGEFCLPDTRNAVIS